MKIFRLLLTSTIGCFFALLPIRAAVVTNGGFDTGDLSGWQVQHTIMGEWYSSNYPVLEYLANGSGHYAHLKAEGGQEYITYQGIRIYYGAPWDMQLKMWQTVTVMPGAILSFDYMRPSSENSYGGSATAYFAGMQSNLSETPPNVWQHFVSSPTTLSGAYDITFSLYAGTGPGNVTNLYVDNIFITPEPSSVVLVGIGVGCILIYVWRRRTWVRS
jgi:hypothetical protein